MVYCTQFTPIQCLPFLRVHTVFASSFVILYMGRTTCSIYSVYRHVILTGKCSHVDMLNIIIRRLPRGWYISSKKLVVLNLCQFTESCTKSMKYARFLVVLYLAKHSNSVFQISTTFIVIPNPKAYKHACLRRVSIILLCMYYMQQW